MEEKTKGKDTNSKKSKDSESSELKLGGNIALAGFSLEPIEMIVVKKIIGHYVKKISEKIDYHDVKITLKEKAKAKSFLHEVNVSAKTSKGILAANSINNNLYTALSEALEKVYSQAEHEERTARQ